MDLAVDAQQLARRYGARWALVDVSMQVPRGSVAMIAGRNGSGKTTLLRLLATAIRPDRGSARVHGFDVVKEREDVRLVSALLSHSSYLYESLTARENLAVMEKGETSAVLARVGLAERANDAVATFSAGMRKRLSFARVLLQRPHVAMLDEPYGQLDPEGFAMVDEVIAELKSQGATVLVATHQVDRVATFADQVIHLEAGRVR